MATEFKSFLSKSKKIEGRKVTGVFAVIGNLDDGDDIIMPGAFTKTLSEGRRRFRHLWNHQMSSVPTAVIHSIRELDRGELPEDVTKEAPDALGGVEVSREYLETPRGEEVFQAITKGAVDEMSFAFDVILADREERRGEASGRTRFIRKIKELRLWETSDVNWGMNPATLAARSLSTGDNLIKSLDALIREIKVSGGGEFMRQAIELAKQIEQLSNDWIATQKQTQEPKESKSLLAELALADSKLMELKLSALRA